jgi:hypothetical protein
MLIWPTFLLLQEREGITAPLRGFESDLARSAQMVNHKKDLVPREVGALVRHVFEVARMCVTHHVDYLIFRVDLLRHMPPLNEERNKLLRIIVHCRCQRMVSPDGGARSSVAQGVTGLTHKREGRTIR